MEERRNTEVTEVTEKVDGISVVNPIQGEPAFPDDASVIKVLRLAIERAAKTLPVQNWGTVVNRLVILFGERMIIE